jgi:8-amino-7-oxononanoate synthase
MPIMQSPPGAETIIDGRRYLYFAGTGYLGLQGHPEVIRAACEATRQYGIGSATSRAGFGDTPPTLAVEQEASRLFGCDDSFYFVSGYVGNQILVAAFQDRFDAVFVDEFSHYSVFETARGSGRPVSVFRHRDWESLDEGLRRNLKPGDRPLVMSDGVFAALGRIAPVAQYAAVLRNYPGAMLLIDDAHAIGVLGAGGRGTYEHAGLIDRPVNAASWSREDEAPAEPALCFCGTLSKAIGGFGGIIPGKRQWIDRLKRSSHFFDGASPPPIPAAAATARALKLVIADPGMRTRLWKNVQVLKAGLQRLGLDVDDTPVPISCLTIGSGDAMRRIQSQLAERGIMIAYMPSYSGLGPAGALRLAVFATHTEAMIRQLLDELARLL